MAEFNGMLPVSFLEIEVLLFNRVRELFLDVMKELLEFLDEIVFEGHDSERYKVKETKKGRRDTLLGPVEYRRRVYRDVKTGEWVYGLDEALGLEKRARISPGLRQAAVLQAVDGPSYRSARDSLKAFYGHQVLSHETIRQCVLKVGEGIRREAKRQRDNPQGKRKVKVLFVEADGVWVSRQHAGKKEARLVISHEGWRPRTGATGEYELIGRSHYYADEPEEDLWEEASRHLYSTYDLTDTMVVINGDRAKWIRRGVEYFPKAIYQFDRFHLIRDLKACLREEPETFKSVLKALEGNDPQAVLDILRQVRLRDRKARRALADLVRDLESIPEAMIDYRLRLKAKGYDTAKMRGMGAAESNINKFSRRLKKQGRSWSEQGLSAIIYSMAKRFEGTLTRFTEHLDRLDEILDEERLAKGAGHIVKEVVSDIANSVGAHIPLLNAGRNRSGGLSQTLRQLNNALPTSIA